MRTVCVDQSMYRSPELAGLVNNPDVRFVVPDAALMEMCKSEEWEATLRRSLKILSRVPDRVVVAKGNGECMKEELDQGCSLTLDGLISTEATIWLRRLLVEVADRKRGEMFELMAAEIDNANERARQEHLDHSDNLDTLKELISTLRSAYSEEFQKRLRSGLVDEGEYVVVVSHAATMVVDDDSMTLKQGSIDVFIKERSYVMRWLWLRVQTVTDWLASGGSDQVAAERVTNSDIDRHYLAVGSYCDELLTKDRNMQVADRRLRAALAMELSWRAELDNGI